MPKFQSKKVGNSREIIVKTTEIPEGSTPKEFPTWRVQLFSGKAKGVLIHLRLGTQPKY